jgi:polar amino acid transport system permease protein
VLGVLVALGRLSKWRVLSSISATYIEVFRDTPVLVQLFWVYYVLPILLGIRIDALTAAILGLTLHSTAFLGEIYRAGIQTVPVGHTEAAKVLGLSPRMTFIRIVLPQAVRNVLPPLVNNLVDLIKLSSLASVFAVGEITRKATELSASTFRPIEIFTFVALMYFFICWPLSLSIRVLERRMRLA